MCDILYTYVLQANGLYLLYLFRLEMSVAAYLDAACVVWREPREGLLVHLARADVLQVADADALAAATASQGDAYEVAPVGHEVHRERVAALLGEERRVYAADAGGVVYERIDAKRRVAADVFGG